MDILGPLPLTPRGNRYVLVLTDYFTKWTESYAIPNQEAATVAEKLVCEFVYRFGVPRELHSDQGTNFESKVMAEVRKLLDIEKTRTSPLRPQSDGQVERYNRTLIEMLRGKLQENQEDWDLQLQTCMMAYRSSVHESTGETPNMLMLGREIEVPLDVITEPPPDSPPLTTEYALALQQRLLGAHEFARRHLGKAAERQKRNYDKRASSKPFRVGDSVWLNNVRRRKGRNPKLDCPWEGPYLVVSVLSDVTYRIKRNRRTKPKVIHADRLKPYLGPALESWISQKEKPIVSVVPLVNLAEGSESVVADNALSTQLKEDNGGSRVDSEPSNSALEENNLEVRAPVFQDIGSDLETEAKARSDRPPRTSENVQKNPKGRHGRERRKPQRYGEWV